MGNIITIFKKEMLDMLRDRRTVLTMIVMPIVLMPLMISILSKVTSDRMKEAQEKIIKIGVIANDNGAGLQDRLKLKKDVKIIDGISKDGFEELIRNDSLDVVVEINENFDQELSGGNTAKVKVFYDSTDEGIYKKRAEDIIEEYNIKVLNARLDSVGINQAMINPIEASQQDVYTDKESFGKMAGGMLPYVFVLFCLMGAMYPAIDLFTGEKERGTIETILTVPASRIQILIGKLLVVVISGVISGVLVIFGMYLTLIFHPDVPPMVLNIVNQILTPFNIGMIILMLIPLTTFFAGILIPISIYSKSFKEAQSLITPLTFVAIFPLIIGMLPGFKLTVLTALIPVANVALATKEIIAGTIDYGLLGLVFLSLFVFATIGIGMCVKWFSSEGNILRT